MGKTQNHGDLLGGRLSYLSRWEGASSHQVVLEKADARSRVCFWSRVVG